MDLVPSVVIDTDRASPRERFSLWRDALAATHQVTLPEGCEPKRFSANARGWHLGSSLMLEARSTPQALLRSPRTIRADQIDHYVICVQKSGCWSGGFAGNTVAAGPGSVTVIDMARSTDVRTSDIESINLLLSRDALDDLLPPVDMHGLVLRNGMAGVIRSHVSGLAANLSRLQIPDARRISDATLSLVAACLAPSRETVAGARVSFETALIADIRSYIDRHLDSPQLSPRDVGEALGLSRSTLYAVCEPMGGVAAFIQKRRLKRIHAILADPRDRRGIAEIAYQNGFTSGSHFSRAFRSAFGYSPREAREVAAAGPAIAGNVAAEGSTYGAWIRQLSG